MAIDPEPYITITVRVTVALHRRIRAQPEPSVNATVVALIEEALERRENRELLHRGEKKP